MTQKFPIQVNEGEDKAFELSLVDLSGQPYNLTGCDVKAQVRNENDELILNMTAVVQAASTGVVRLFVAANDSLGKVGVHYWDLKIETPDNRADYLERSKFAIRKTVTR